MVLQFSYFTIYISVGGSSRVVSERLPPLTSQQDHSAKKIPKKSNNVNENEENVLTIPQESHKRGTIKILNISMM